VARRSVHALRLSGRHISRCEARRWNFAPTLTITRTRASPARWRLSGQGCRSVSSSGADAAQTRQRATQQTLLGASTAGAFFRMARTGQDHGLSRRWWLSDRNLPDHHRARVNGPQSRGRCAAPEFTYTTYFFAVKDGNAGSGKAIQPAHRTTRRIRSTSRPPTASVALVASTPAGNTHHGVELHPRRRFRPPQPNGACSGPTSAAPRN